MMHVVSRKKFYEAVEQYPSEKPGILNTMKLLERGDFNTPEELKNSVNHLDNFKHKKGWWVIDIGGGKLRMLAYIDFEHNTLYVKHIVSHAEYDKITALHRRKPE